VRFCVGLIAADQRNITPKVVRQGNYVQWGIFKVEILCSPCEPESMVEMTTDRLVLRHWRQSDRERFACMNADPRVMQFFPSLLSAEESGQLADRIEEHFRRHSFGLYATELREDHSFIGYIGLSVPTFQAAFTPCVEIGWRLSPDHWGKGLATEGARAVVRQAFESLGLGDLVSFTVPANLKSRRLMEKLGMSHDPAEDFDHPRLPEGHPLRRHVLYRLRRSDAVI
jgi:RimJ/RimL family protein N-acetyltransferase